MGLIPYLGLLVIKCLFKLQLSQLKKEDVVALGKAIDGFLSSDVGKMAQAVVFAAFPEMKIVKDVAMPIMRQFIKKVTKTERLWAWVAALIVDKKLI